MPCRSSQVVECLHWSLFHIQWIASSQWTTDLLSSFSQQNISIIPKRWTLCYAQVLFWWHLYLRAGWPTCVRAKKRSGLEVEDRALAEPQYMQKFFFESANSWFWVIFTETWYWNWHTKVEEWWRMGEVLSRIQVRHPRSFLACLFAFAQYFVGLVNLICLEDRKLLVVALRRCCNVKRYGPRGDKACWRRDRRGRPSNLNGDRRQSGTLSEL